MKATLRGSGVFFIHIHCLLLDCQIKIIPLFFSSTFWCIKPFRLVSSVLDTIKVRETFLFAKVASIWANEESENVTKKRLRNFLTKTFNSLLIIWWSKNCRPRNKNICSCLRNSWNSFIVNTAINFQVNFMVLFIY